VLGWGWAVWALCRDWLSVELILKFLFIFLFKPWQYVRER